MTLPEALRRGDRGALLVLIFPSIGLLLVWAVVTRLAREARFRRIFLRLEVPAVIGGPARGRIEVGVPLPDGTAVTLQYLQVTGSGKRRTTHEKELWQDQRAIPRGMCPTGPNGTVIPVDFVIPAGLSDSSLELSDSRHEWRLEAVAPLAGPDLDARFEIPAFGVGA
jgi:hypothetical protein